MPTAAAATPRPCVVVTTYARPDSLALLLDDIERDSPPGGLDVRIYDDGTPSPAAVLQERVRARGWTYRRAHVNHGKRGWWRWWNTILDDLRGSPAGLYYVLQDDMRLCERFFERSADLWSEIDDPQKASLYLHLSAERAELGGRCWTPVHATRVGPVVHSGWVDCAAFMCDRRLFESLAWRLHPIPDRRWHGKDVVSSGVGQQISLRAQKLGLGLYRVDKSLTAHDGSPSLMSPEARRRWSMETVGFIDGHAAARAHARPRPHVFASLATIPARERALRHVVEALLPQVDSLGVYLNDYDRVPAFLDREQILVARSQDSGVRGDVGKFFWAGTTSGYQLVCDDDIDYPEDYVDRLVEGIERHRRRAVVGFHGCVLRDSVADYHSSRKLLHFTRALAADSAVHVLGTGVAGYHASAISVSPQDFAAPNMADIWLARLGQRQGVPFVCLRRADGWLGEVPGLRGDSLYLRARRRAAVPGAGPSPETLAVREQGRWELQTPPGERADAAVSTVTRPVRRRVYRAWPEPRRPSVRPLVRVRVAGPEHSATLVLPERDHITDAVQRSGTYYERDLLDAIRARVDRGVFVDVGAHYGNHTTFFGLECGAEHVVAIEPSPLAFAGLLETVAENGLQRVVATHRVAAHPEWRNVTVTALPWRPRPGASVQTNSGRVGISPATRGGDAPAAPLDEILEGVQGVALIKVDAEGMSAQILASGRRMLRRDRPLVAAEAAADAERHALRAVLSGLGYREVGRYCWTATWLWEPAPV
jgi:FkbM family methyltransferase